MGVKISVVIPMYNGSATIGNCLSKLSQQTFSGKYEVIIVDDASTDGSGEKVEAMVSSFVNSDLFTVIKCEKNGRAGNARNVGIQAAKGEYVLFIDQDDYPDEKMLAALYDLSDGERIDCVSCNVADKGGAVYERVQLGMKQSLQTEDRCALMREHGYVFAMLIRRKIILENHIYFPTNVMFEDSLYNIGVFACISSFCNTKEALYYREVDENSQTANFTLKKISDRVEATKWYLANYKENLKVQAYKAEMNREAFYYIYLSCVWWMLINKNIFDDKMVKKCISDTKDLNISWKEICRVEKRFGGMILKILKVVYFHPKMDRILSNILSSVYETKKKRKKG